MSNMNERDVAILVRDALSVYYQQQAARPDTLSAELEAEAQAGLRTIQNLVDDMARQRRVWLANDMPAQLADVEKAPEGAYSRERWIEIQALFDAFGKWLETPLAVADGVSATPLVIISRRGNPPAQTVKMTEGEEGADGEV